MMADGNGGMDRLASLRARVAAAKVEAAKPLLSDADREEMELRAEEAKHLEARKSAERDARLLDLARREDAARERLGPKIPIATIEGEADGFVHTFIVKHAGAKPFAAWQDGIAMAVTGQKHPRTGQKVDRTENTRAFALASVEDWNGTTDLRPGTNGHAELVQVLTEFPGIASSIANSAAKLAGFAMEERKS